MRPDRLVLDTNIVSYIMKGHSLAIRYEKHLQGRLQTVLSSLLVSSISVLRRLVGAWIS